MYHAYRHPHRRSWKLTFDNPEVQEMQALTWYLLIHLAAAQGLYYQQRGPVQPKGQRDKRSQIVYQNDAVLMWSRSRLAEQDVHINTFSTAQLSDRRESRSKHEPLLPHLGASFGVGEPQLSLLRRGNCFGMECFEASPGHPNRKTFSVTNSQSHLDTAGQDTQILRAQRISSESMPRSPFADPIRESVHRDNSFSVHNTAGVSSGMTIQATDSSSPGQRGSITIRPMTNTRSFADFVTRISGIKVRPIGRSRSKDTTEGSSHRSTVGRDASRTSVATSDLSPPRSSLSMTSARSGPSKTQGKAKVGKKKS